MTGAFLTGGCACDAIRYQVDRRPVLVQSCHCSVCRKVFSAQASVYAQLAPDSFQWLSGQEKLSTFINKAGHGVGFCSLCGSTLCGLHEGQVVGITLGCVDGQPDLQIDRHIYVASKANWEMMPENVCQFDGSPDH